MNWNLHIPKGDWDTLKYVVIADFHRMLALIESAMYPICYFGVTFP